MANGDQNGRRFVLSKEITLGNILSMLLIMLSAIGIYVGLVERLAKLEERQTTNTRSIEAGILPNAVANFARVATELQHVREAVAELKRVAASKEQVEAISVRMDRLEQMLFKISAPGKVYKP